MDDKGNDLDQMLSNLGIGTDEEAQQGGVMPDDIDMDAAMVSVNVISDDAPAQERAEAFLVGLLLNIDPTYVVDVYEVTETELLAEVSGGDAGRLIGKGGRTLAALEQIVNAVVNRAGEEPIRINVDVGGYKRRRDERLTKQARAAADQVRKLGEPVELEPMSAAERRIIHMAVADDPDIRSESAGEGRDRRVVLHLAHEGAGGSDDDWDDGWGDEEEPGGWDDENDTPAADSEDDQANERSVWGDDSDEDPETP